jgi:hypothetical protein
MSPPNFTFVVALEFEPAWLALGRDVRRDWAGRVAAIAARHPTVTTRWFDADAFGRGYTDFAICECADPEAYHALWEELRDTELFSTPYLRIRDVKFGIERGYERYEARAAK